MTSQSPFLLSIRNLHVRIALNDIFRCEEFILQRGDKVLLTSASGFGKSVFLNCVAGLLPTQFVVNGEFIRNDNNEMKYETYVRHRRPLNKVGMIFQDAVNSLHPFRPVRDQLKRFPKDKLTQDLLSFGFNPEKRDFLAGRHFRNQLSGGECQRISLLYALDAKKELLLLDEPLTDIDTFARQKIEDILADRIFEKLSDKTAILVTHNAEWLRDKLDPNSIRHFVIDDDGGRGPELYEVFGERKLEQVQWNLPKAERSTVSGLPAAFAEQPIFRFRVQNRIDLKSGNTNFTVWPFQQSTGLSNGLELRRGEGVALYGLSGSGKSFLLRSIAGLWSRTVLRRVDRQADFSSSEAGAMQDINRMEAAQLASNIQYIFQNNRASVILTQTIDEDLKELKELAVRRTRKMLKSQSGKSPLSISDHEIGQSIDCMIEDLWLNWLKIPHSAYEQRDQRRVFDLSLGMLRRYIFIRALIKLDVHTAWQQGEADDTFKEAPWQVRFKPRLLLADEISRGLDSNSLQGLARLIVHLKEKAGLSIIVVSHENKFIAALAERVFLIVDGFVMPTPFAPKEVPNVVESTTEYFAPEPSLINPIYSVYCSPTHQTSNGTGLPSPEFCEKLLSSSTAGCVVARMLGGNSQTGQGCPNNGHVDCSARALAENNQHGVCC